MATVTGTPGPAAASPRPGGPAGPARAADVVNAMSVDVEDYFQVSGFEDVVARETWSGYESRVCRNTDLLLQIFDEAGIRATFFVLGWVGERFPDLVRRIAVQGHEIASHSHEHRLVYRLSREEFREDLRRARAVLEDAGGGRVAGYRAPSYSITNESLWALDVLIEEGYLYDSSIYPIRHDRYGIPSWPRHLTRVVRPQGTLWEFPGSTVKLGGANLPIGGGGYFRLLPYQWTRFGFRRVNAAEHLPAMFYVHPWELDPDQPRLAGSSALSRFRHYRNLALTAERLRALVREFRFGRAIDVVQAHEQAATV